MIHKSTQMAAATRRFAQVSALTLPWTLAALLAAAPAAHAAPEKQEAQQRRTQQEPKLAKKGAVRIKDQQNHSGETPAQRDKRLLRECKGLPNAGACRGYTSR